MDLRPRQAEFRSKVLLLCKAEGPKFIEEISTSEPRSAFTLLGEEPNVLACGSKREIKAVAGFFGLDYYPQGNQIVHSLRTALIAPDGRVAKAYSGNEWKPADVLHDLAALPR